MTEARHAQAGSTWEEDQIGHVGWAALLYSCLCDRAQGGAAGQVACPRDAAVHHAVPPVDYDHASAAGARLQGRPHPAPGSIVLLVILSILVVLLPGALALVVFSARHLISLLRAVDNGL